MNAPNATQCPTDAVLSDFGLGKLDAASAETVTRHLETCADCQQRVAVLSGDSFVDLLREARHLADAESVSLASTREQRVPDDERGDPAPTAPIAAANQPVEIAAALPAAFGRYRVTKLLGQGGFGVVYLGHDPELQREVAIKVPRSDRVSSPADAEAYLAEARLLAAVTHPGIVPVYDFGRTPDGLCYVVSQLMPNGDLGALLSRRRLTLEEAVGMAAQIADALNHAHQHGLVHRDVKPGNILIDRDGRPQVADFGLALTDESYGDGAGVFGTPAYMSPEQARGESHRVDARSDIYSLGVLFYELLTGRRPYRRTESRDLLEEISSGDVRPPRQLDHTIPQELERICLKALAKRPADRYTTAFDMAEELRRWQSRSAAQREQSTDAPTDALPNANRKSNIKNEPRHARNFKVLIGCGGLLTVSVTATVAVLLVMVFYRQPIQVAQVRWVSPREPAVEVSARAKSPVKPNDAKPPAPPPQPPPVLADPWAAAKATALTSYRLIAIEDPKTKTTWPFAGAVIVGPQTLLTTADVAIELARLRERGMEVKALRDSQESGVPVDRVRIHALFQNEKADEQVYFDLAILSTTQPLTAAASQASAAELEAIERGQPLACLAIDHFGDPVDRFQQLAPEWQSGKVFAATRLSSEAGAPRILRIRGAFSDKSSGSPIFDDQGHLVAVYCGPVPSSGGPPERALHYATLIEPQLIELGVHESESAIWATPESRALVASNDNGSSSSVSLLGEMIYADALALRATDNVLASVALTRNQHVEVASKEMETAVQWVNTYFTRRANRPHHAAEEPSYLDRAEKREETYRRIVDKSLASLNTDLSDDLNWMLREILANTSYTDFMSDTANSVIGSQHNAPLSAADRHNIQLTEGNVAGSKAMRFRADTAEVLETRWPIVLRDDRYKAARKAFDDAHDWAVAELKNDQAVSKRGADNLMAAIDRLTSELATAYPRERLKTIPPRDMLAYLSAKRFLQLLAALTFRFVETNSAVAFDDLYRFQGKTVRELLQHMMNQGLEFAPAEPGGEATYKNLYQCVRGFYLQIVPDPNKFGGR